MKKNGEEEQHKGAMGQPIGKKGKEDSLLNNVEYKLQQSDHSENRDNHCDANQNLAAVAAVLPDCPVLLTASRSSHVVGATERTLIHVARERGDVLEGHRSDSSIGIEEVRAILVAQLDAGQVRADLVGLGDLELAHASRVRHEHGGQGADSGLATVAQALKRIR